MTGAGIIQTVTHWLGTLTRAEKRARDEGYFIAAGADLCLCVRTEMSGRPLFRKSIGPRTSPQSRPTSHSNHRHAIIEAAEVK